MKHLPIGVLVEGRNRREMLRMRQKSDLGASREISAERVYEWASHSSSLSVHPGVDPDHVRPDHVDDEGGRYATDSTRGASQ
jgi:hypothetical protein